MSPYRKSAKKMELDDETLEFERVLKAAQSALDQIENMTPRKKIFVKEGARTYVRYEDEE